MAVNVVAIQNRANLDESIARFNQIAQILTGYPEASASDGVAWIENLGNILDIPPLSQYGLSQADFQVVIEKTSVASSTKGNPITLSADEMATILAKAL
jgi:alcohol dehydrogenase class IV